MKLSFSTNAFVRYSVSQAVEKLADIGYDGVELLADIPHLYVHSITSRDQDRLREALDRSEVEVANINAATAKGYYGRNFWDPLFEPSLANPNPSLRKWRLDYTKKCLDLARALGAPGISISPGRMLPGTMPEQSFDFLRESLRELIEHAAQRGVRIALGYGQGLLLEYAAELAALIRDLASPHLGADLDLGYSHILNEDPAAVIQTFGPKLFHVRLEDIRARKHYHLIPGTGDLDFDALFQTLDRRGYAGFATVDLYTFPYQADEAARRAYEYLVRLPYWRAQGSKKAYR